MRRMMRRTIDKYRQSYRDIVSLAQCAGMAHRDAAGIWLAYPIGFLFSDLLLGRRALRLMRGER